MFRLNPSEKQRFKKILARSGFLLLAGLLYAAVIRVSGKAIPCPYRTVFGRYCPGCGVTGMALALLRLDPAAAFRCHPVLFCSLPPLGLCFGAQAYRYVRTGKTNLSRWQNAILWIVIAALLAFCVYRNVS